MEGPFGKKGQSFGLDPQDRTAVQIRKLRDDMKRNAQVASLKRLKRKLQPDETLITRTGTDGAEGDDG